MGGLYYEKIYKNISRCGVLGIGKNEERIPIRFIRNFFFVVKTYILDLFKLKTPPILVPNFQIWPMSQY